MRFTTDSLEPFGQTLLDISIETDLGLKTPVVFRAVKLLRKNRYLPEYGTQMCEVSLEEAIANAMVHGNKLDPDKKIRVILCGDGKTFGVIIDDQGAGFSKEDLPDARNADNLLRERGRGFMLMDHYMKVVEYNATLKRLRMTREKQTAPDEGSLRPVEPPVATVIPTIFSLDDFDDDTDTLERAETPVMAAVILPDEIELDLGPIKPIDKEEQSEVLVVAKNGRRTVEAPAGPVTVSTQGAVVVARIHIKRLTEDSAAPVRQALSQAASQSGKLVIDMAALEFMSSVGISIIIGAYKQAAQKKGKVVLAGPSPAIKNILAATGLLKAFIIEADVDAAIKKLG